jgi:hypothetical protein
MKKTFITSKGSIELDRNVLFIRTRKFYFHETGFARIIWALLPLVFLILVLCLEHDPFKFYVRVVFFAIWTIDKMPLLYRLVLKTSFSNRIPVERIESVEIEEDRNGLEVHLLLRLKNNRVRRIAFRKLEKQYEELLESISLQPSNMGIA